MKGIEVSVTRLEDINDNKWKYSYINTKYIKRIYPIVYTEQKVNGKSIYSETYDSIKGLAMPIIEMSDGVEYVVRGRTMAMLIEKIKQA